MKKIILSLLLVLMMIVPATVVSAADYSAFKGGVTEIDGYGNLVLSISSEELSEAGYEYGDMLKVTINDKAYDMPFCPSYSDVETGDMLVRDNDGVLTVAINMGDFATTGGIAEKTEAEDGTYAWVFPKGETLEDVTVSLEMGEKGGYHDEYLIHHLERTNDRTDYTSDQEFANFRNIAYGKLGENALFRSSSPVNNELGRSAYADDLAEAAGVQTVMNLADSNEMIETYFTDAGFDSPYYRSLYEKGQVKALQLGMDFSTADFRSGVAEGMRFFTSQEGPYLVHCTEGKDRCGFVSALLSCFMGASYDEVEGDYMQTYINYYHLSVGSEQYEAVIESNFVPILQIITGAGEGEDMTDMDLAAAAEEYLADIGLSKKEISSLKKNLSKDHTAEASGSESTYTVESGDCLWEIAEKTYGNGYRWVDIYQANRDIVRHPDFIDIGQVLKLPAA
ncbi:MAG: SAM-dependent chlorinase/fluorinase [Bacillota bacterium]|nr:SAM-dependent chlorinase/fluorinase [Bacillota bacterium]